MINKLKQKNIPNGWKIGRLGDEVSIFGGEAFSSLDSVENGARWLKIANVGIEKIKWDDKSFLPVSFLKTYNKCVLKNDDIILALTRPTLGNRLKIAKVTQSKNDVLMNQRVGKLIFSNKVNSDFIYYFLTMKKSAYYINQVITGSDPPNLGVNSFNFIKLYFPSFLPEQKRIVRVLETWDEAIEKLNRKIEIKKKVKRGLMQKLLTGTVRLPGFVEEWKTVELRSLLEYERPDKYIVKNTNYCDKNKTPVLTANKSFVLGYTDESEGIYDNTPVIIFDDFTVDNKYVDFPFKVKSSAIKILKTKNNKVNLKFIFEKMQLVKFIIGEHKRNYISEYQYIDMKIPDKEEQNAIANVLIAADNEIEVLEKQLSLLKDQKKYLLNNLVTGKIRTPENLSIVNK